VFHTKELVDKNTSSKASIDLQRRGQAMAAHSATPFEGAKTPGCQWAVQEKGRVPEDRLEREYFEGDNWK